MTFFFNGGLEKQWEMEDREMVPSPKVATYDLQPTMNAAGVAEAVSKSHLNIDSVIGSRPGPTEYKCVA